VFEEARSSGYPALVKLKATAQISNVDDIVEKYSESVIQPAIDQLEKLDFYQYHLNTLDLQRNRRQDEGIERFVCGAVGPQGSLHRRSPPLSVDREQSQLAGLVGCRLYCGIHPTNKQRVLSVPQFEASLTNSPVGYYWELTLSFRLKYCRLVII
jgi:hypothetical protein